MNWTDLKGTKLTRISEDDLLMPSFKKEIVLKVDNILPPGTVSLDLETASVAEMWKSDPSFMRLAGYGIDQNPIQTTISTEELIKVIKDHDGWVIGHNLLNFDLIILNKYFGLDILQLGKTGRIIDTKLLAFLADPPYSRTKEGEIEKTYSLQNIGTKYLGVGKLADLKILAQKHGGFDQIPVDDQEYNDYLKRDVEVTRDLAKVIEINDYALREHKIAAIASSISLQGFKIDVSLLNQKIREGEEKRVQILEELAMIGLPGPETTKAPHRTNAGIEAIDTAFRKLNVELPRSPKSGKAALGKEVLLGVIESAQNSEVVDLAEAIMSLNGIRSIYGNIFDNLVGDRVHPSINLRQSTGRWSIQNPGLTVVGKHGGKVKEREVFLPDNENHVLISCDLAQVDARAVAGLSQDPAYIALFDPGKDLHSEMALELFGNIDKRELAKAASHGINYSMRPKKLSLVTGMSLMDAEDFIAGFEKKFHVLANWQYKVRVEGETVGILYNGFGRKMKIESDRAYTQCVPLHSEILTRTGWKTWDQVNEGADETLGLNEEGRLVWTPVLKVSVFQNRDTVRLSKKYRFDVECTPNHRWVSNRDFGNGRTGHWYKQILVETSDLKTTDRLVLAAAADTKTELPELSLADAEILGWVLGDGTLTWHEKGGNAFQRSRGQFVRFDIVQCKPEQVEHLRNLTRGWAEYGPAPTNGTYDKFTFTLKPEKARQLLQRAGLSLPDQKGSKEDLNLNKLVLDMDFSQREAFLEGFWRAEGYTEKGVQVYTQNEGPIMEAIQLAIFLQGQFPSVSKRSRKCKEFRGTTPHVSVQNLNQEPTGSKDVWCPTTELGTWVMKQNGRIFLTGNSPALMGQSTARDILCEGLLRLWEMGGDDVIKMIRGVIHDEVVLSCSIKDAKEIKDLVVKALSFEWCPEGGSLPVQIIAGLNEDGINWRDCYKK